MKKLFKAMLATTVLCGLSFQASAQNECPKCKLVSLVGAFSKADIPNWAAVVKSSGAKAD